MNPTDIAQTAVISVATVLAFATYRSNRRDRLNEIDERHLENVATRVVEVHSACREYGAGKIVLYDVRSAQDRLEASLFFVWQPLPHVHNLTTLSPERIHQQEILLAAAEVADAIEALPRGPWYLPQWMRRNIYWRRFFGLARYRFTWPIRRLRRLWRPLGEDEVEA